MLAAVALLLSEPAAAQALRLSRDLGRSRPETPSAAVGEPATNLGVQLRLAPDLEDSAWRPSLRLSRELAPAVELPSTRVREAGADTALQLHVAGDLKSGLAGLRTALGAALPGVLAGPAHATR